MRSLSLALFLLGLTLGLLTSTTVTVISQDSATLQRAARTDDSLSYRYGHAKPFPKREGTIRIASYNLNHLYDHDDDPTLLGEHDDMQHAISHNRATAIAKVIRSLDADIVALQEVESLDALRWYRDEYLSDMGYDHLASEDVGYHRGMENSVMSRFKISKVEVRMDLSLRDVEREGPGWSEAPQAVPQGFMIQRSPLRVDIKVNEEYDLTLFVVHHKAGRDFQFQRESESVVTLDWVNQIASQNLNRNIIILGDFNAAPWDKSYRLYLERGFVDTLAHRIIPRSSDESQEEARLYKTHESGRVIDYILMNSAAYREFVVGSAQVVGTFFPPSSYDWRNDPFPPGYCSDHYPVLIDIVPQDQP